MLAEGVLEYAVVSGLVMEQSGQGSLWSCFATVYHEKRYTKKCEFNCKQLLMYLFIVALHTFIANYEN